MVESAAPDMQEELLLDNSTLVEFSRCQWDRDITIMVPCYNEEDNVVATLDTIIGALKTTNLTWEILVINDASMDRSQTMVTDYITVHSDLSIRLINRSRNHGLAENFMDGAFIARGKFYKLVSGDNAEPVETLTAIFKHVGRTDMIIPYYLRIDGRSLSRNIISKTYTSIINFLSGYGMHYYNGGAVHRTFNVMRWRGDCSGFSFQADIITRLLDEGVTYIEVPVTSRERSGGKSTALQLRNFLSVARLFLELVIRRTSRMYHNYRKRRILTKHRHS